MDNAVHIRGNICIVGKAEANDIRVIGKRHDAVCHKRNKLVPGNGLNRPRHAANLQPCDMASFRAESSEGCAVVCAAGINNNRISPRDN